MRRLRCLRCETTVTADNDQRTYCFRTTDDGWYCGGRLIPSGEPAEAC